MTGYIDWQSCVTELNQNQKQNKKGGGLIFYEYTRSNNKELEKKRQKEERRREKELKQMRMNVHQMEIIGNIERRLKKLEQKEQPSSRWPWQTKAKAEESTIEQLSTTTTNTTTQVTD